MSHAMFAVVTAAWAETFTTVSESELFWMLGIDIINRFSRTELSESIPFNFSGIVLTGV